MRTDPSPSARFMRPGKWLWAALSSAALLHCSWTIQALLAGRMRPDIGPNAHERERVRT